MTQLRPDASRRVLPFPAPRPAATRFSWWLAGDAFEAILLSPLPILLAADFGAIAMNELVAREDHRCFDVSAFDWLAACVKERRIAGGGAVYRITIRTRASLRAARSA